MPSPHCSGPFRLAARAIVAAMVLCAPGAAGGSRSVEAAQELPPAPPAASTFTVFFRSAVVGTEQISVERVDDGWTLQGSGRLGAPFNLLVRRLEIRYDSAWNPRELTIDATQNNQIIGIHTTVTGSTAYTRVVRPDGPTEKTDTLGATSLLLPSSVFAPFEALAARARTATAGTTMAAYEPPLGPLTITIGESTTDRIQTLARVITARRTQLAIAAPGQPATNAEVWGDETGRLLRVSIPGQLIDVLRQDLASVSTRRVTITRAGDESVLVPANGFSLTGSISKPNPAPSAPLPAVILVSGSSLADRDETVAGVPIFGQLAEGLADAGFLVLRYDKRGVGQSGGRPEAAAVADYAEDLRAAVKFLASRKDVDRKRIAVLGYDEGGAVAMMAASDDRRVTALALVGASGVSGAELNLYQAAHALERSTASEEKKQATLALQKQIQTAALTGKGWEGIPAGLKRQADVPWFQSYLAYDPAKVMPRVSQPVLVVQGALDVQVPPSNAERLGALAKARRKGPGAEVVVVPGVNHLLVPATTGEVDEYGALPDRHISPSVVAAVSDWLKKTGARDR